MKKRFDPLTLNAGLDESLAFRQAIKDSAVYYQMENNNHRRIRSKPILCDADINNNDFTEFEKKELTLRNYETRLKYWDNELQSKEKILEEKIRNFEIKERNFDRREMALKEREDKIFRRERLMDLECQQVQKTSINKPKTVNHKIVNCECDNCLYGDNKDIETCSHQNCTGAKCYKHHKNNQTRRVIPCRNGKECKRGYNCSYWHSRKKQNVKTVKPVQLKATSNNLQNTRCRYRPRNRSRFVQKGGQRRQSYLLKGSINRAQGSSSSDSD